MILTILKRFNRYMAVKNAKRHADRMAKETNTSMYVIQIFKKIRVYDRRRINNLIQAGILSTKLRNALELEKVCIYIARPPKNNHAKIIKLNNYVSNRK